MSPQDRELVLNVLRRLSEAGGLCEDSSYDSAIEHVGGIWVPTCQLSSREVTSAALLATESDVARQIWTQLEDYTVSFAAIRRTLLALMSQSGVLAVRAAHLYACIIQIPGCPVVSLFDPLTATIFLKVIRQPPAKQTGAQGAKEETAMDVDGTGEDDEVDGHRSGAVTGMAGFLSGFGLRDQPEMLRGFAETVAEAARSSSSSDGVAKACFALLLELLRPFHGNARETAAMIMRPLTPGLLGVHTAAGGQKGSAVRSTQAVRAAILQFATEALGRSVESREAVAGLARHVVLKAPDKAEFRIAATESAVTLVQALPTADQHQFVLFAARLSRTAKVAQRMLGVELAAALFDSFPEPFSSAAAYEVAQGGGSPQHSASAASTPNGAAPATHEIVPDSAVLLADQPRASNTAPASWGTVCIAVLVQRCSDKSAAVRSKALGCLASIVLTWTDKKGASVQDLALLRQALAQANSMRMQQPFSGFTPVLLGPATVSPANAEDPGATPMADGTPGSMPAGVGASGAPFAQKKGGLHRALLESAFHAAAARSHAPVIDLDVDSLVALARRRARDEKATVRKAALQLLDALLLMRARGSGGAAVELPSEADVSAVEGATADPLVSVRKAGLQAAARLLKELPGDVAMADLWIRAVLPMIRDVEASLQDAVLDQFEELIVARVAAAGASRVAAAPKPAATAAAESVRGILAALAGSGAAGQACLAHAVTTLAARKRLKGDKAAAGLQGIIAGFGDDSEIAGQHAVAKGAWLLLAEVSARSPSSPSWEFLQEQWQALKQQGMSTQAAAMGDEGAIMLRVIAHASRSFPLAEAQQLAADLLKAVKSFALPAAATAAHIAALAQLTAVREDEGSKPAKRPAKDVMTWTAEVLAAAEAALSTHVQQCGEGGNGGDVMGPADWRATAAVFTAGEVTLLQACKPSGRLVVLVQALTSVKLASGVGSSQAGGDVAVPAPVQAHAWIALGKLCLMDAALAKKCLPLFVQELRCASAPAVRNNIMVALADLCIQYTALVDTHVPRLAACLADPHELVRRQALALLANLLSKDFVKWRGALFHRFTLALVDSSPSVRCLAEYLLAESLATKAPLLAYNHFMESLFVLNDCREGLHGAVGTSSQDDPQAALPSQDGHGAFNLAGKASHMQAKRDTIYRTLLRQMAPEHRFATAAKLCGEVLAGFNDEVLTLHREGQVLRDALHILASKDIKVSVSKKESAEEEEAPSAASLAGAAKGKVVSVMMRKHLVEGMVPVLAELKRHLEAARHPLLGDLLLTLRVLLKDHKHELEDILVADKQLAKELLYDMRQAELAQQAAAQAATVDTVRQAAVPPAGAASTPGNQIMGRSPQSGGLPAGVQPNTPIAAEVLASARAAPYSGLRGLGGSAGKPSRLQGQSGTPATGPRAAPPASLQLHMPQTAFRTPGAGSSRRTPHLGTPASGSNTAHADGAGTPLSVPRLRPGNATRAPLQDANQQSRLAQVQDGAHRLSLDERGKHLASGNTTGPENDARQSHIVLPSPAREQARVQWRIPESTCAPELEEPAAVKPLPLTLGGPVSPVKPLPRASSRLGGERKRKSSMMPS